MLSLQADLREAPKQDFVDRLEEELKEARTQLQQTVETLRRCVLLVHMYVYVVQRTFLVHSVESSNLQLQGEIDRLPKQQEMERYCINNVVDVPVYAMYVHLW